MNIEYLMKTDHDDMMRGQKFVLIQSYFAFCPNVVNQKIANMYHMTWWHQGEHYNRMLQLECGMYHQLHHSHHHVTWKHCNSLWQLTWHKMYQVASCDLLSPGDHRTHWWPVTRSRSDYQLYIKWRWDPVFISFHPRQSANTSQNGRSSGMYKMYYCHLDPLVTLLKMWFRFWF